MLNEWSDRDPDQRPIPRWKKAAFICAAILFWVMIGWDVVRQLSHLLAMF